MIMKDRVAIVTGASRGIGAAVAVAFAREGASVVLAARDRQRVEQAAEEASAAGRSASSGGSGIAVPCDVSVDADVNRLVDETVSRFGRIDILVANAAVFPPQTPIAAMDLDAWRRLIDINLTGLMLCNRAVLPHMIGRNYGRIQNLGSGLEFAGMPTTAAYAASKGAVSGFTRVAAAEVAAHDIKINVHYPGNIRTDMNPGGKGVPEDAVPCAIWLATLPADGPTGRIFMFDREIVVTHQEVPRSS